MREYKPRFFIRPWLPAAMLLMLVGVAAYIGGYPIHLLFILCLVPLMGGIELMFYLLTGHKRYVIDGRDLVIEMPLWRKRVPLNSITGYRDTFSILSPRTIELLRAGSTRGYTVAPRDEAEFLRDLRQSVPTITQMPPRSLFDW
jgi:hypothetical protein